MTDQHIKANPIHLNIVGKVLHVDGTTSDFAIAGEVPTLRELQSAVGGYIERITIMQSVGWFKEPAVMIANEEGRLKGLMFNMEASFMVNSNIVGDVVVMPKRLLR